MKLHITENIDLSNYTYKFHKYGYDIYSKFVNGKAQWVAVKDKEEPFEISYDQVRGFEPIDPINAKLQHKVRKALKMEQVDDVESRYRVWYHPYGLSDEEDFIDVDAQSEEDAIRFARTCGYVTEVELLS